MENKVLELVKELGFTIMRTSPVYGVEDSRVIAENEDLLIRTTVKSKSLDITILPRESGVYIANFYFEHGEAPDLQFRKYSPEMFDLARRFAAVAGFEI